MKTLQGHVKGGRLILDVPTSLPEGEVIDLVVAGDGDDLDEAERHALHQALAEGWESLKRGEGRPAAKVVEDLRNRK